MPIYEYKCLSCGKRLELMQKFSDSPLSKCPDCGGTMKKLVSNTSFVLKGTGWYKTDYAPKKGGSPLQTEKDNGSRKAAEKTEKKPAAVKAETAKSE